MEMTDTVKRGLVVAAVCAVLLVAGFVMSTIDSSLTDNVAVKQAQLAAIKNKTSTMSTSRMSESDVTGLSEKRLDADTEAVTAFAKELFTWDSKESYDKVRKSIDETYGADLDAGFVLAAEPVIDEMPEGASCAYKSADLYVVGAVTGQRSYLVRATVMLGGTERVMNMGVTVDNDGELSDICFYGFDK